MQPNDQVLRDEQECYFKTQELELKIRRVEGLSSVLIQEQPGWVEMAKRYIAWYEGVEGVIKQMLSCLGTEISSIRDQEGLHTHHEMILMELSQPQNPFFECLGRDDVLFQFRQAKDDRNVMSGYGKGYVVSRPSPDWNVFAARIRGIERALWSSLAFFKLEYARRKEYDRHLAAEKRELQGWEASLHAEQQTLEDREAKIQEEEERLRMQEKEIEDRKQLKASEEARLKKDAATKKQLDAALVKELKAQQDALKQTQDNLSEQVLKAKEAAKDLKTKTQLGKDIQKLKADLRKKDRGPEVEKLTNANIELEAKRKRQAEEIKRLEQKAHDSIKHCAAASISQKEVFTKSLITMRDADAKAAKAQLDAKVQELAEAHQRELETKDKTHKDEKVSIRQKEIERLQGVMKTHQQELDIKGKAHKDDIDSLQAAHIEALKAQYHALEKELERVNGLHQQELAKSEASPKSRGIIRELLFGQR